MILIIAASFYVKLTLAALTMLLLAFAFALVLLVASIKLKVEVDPKVEQVHEALPNIDCGACGFAGCASYAKAVVADAELLGKCAPGGSDVSNKIAQILNLQISGSGKPKRPIVHCRSHTADKQFYATYDGIQSCTAANAQPCVQACNYGCLGFGDCTRACKFDALHIVEGLTIVDYEKCTGCGACAKACPRHLIEMVPFGHENMMTVACKNIENGKTARKMCKVGCIGCSLCVKQTDIFSVENNLATIDYEKYESNEQTETAMNKCPTGVIVLRGRSAPPPRASGEKAASAKE